MDAEPPWERKLHVPGCPQLPEGRVLPEPAAGPGRRGREGTPARWGLAHTSVSLGHSRWGESGGSGSAPEEGAGLARAPLLLWGALGCGRL